MLTRRFLLKAIAAAAAAVSLPRPALALADASSPMTETRLMMGTFVTIKIAGTSSMHAADASGKAFLRMAELEDMLTRFDGSSPLGQLNASGVLRDAPDALLKVAVSSARIYGLTRGAFDPTVLPLLELMEKSAEQAPAAQETAEAAELVGMSHVRIEERNIRFMRSGMKMSLDGIAKGYIADEGARVLRSAGVENFLINAGGDIVAGGSKDGTPWRVAVENPEKYHGNTKYIATRTLTNQAMATSGSYEKVFNVQGTRHHLLNPATGRCTTLPGASVVAPSAMEADALATALCVLSRPVAFTETLPQAACLISLPEGQIRRSSRWS